MHATYSFLIDGLDLTGDDGKPDYQEMADHAESRIEDYIEHQGDSNNWYTSILMVTKAGDVIPLTDETHIQKELEESDHWIVSLPPDQRFERVRRFALECTVREMGLGGSNPFFLTPEERERMSALSFDELTAMINKDAPTELSLSYAELATGRASEDEWPGQTDYRRRKLSKQFELFYGAGCKPFADSIDTPYAYRCYDLREANQGDREIEADTAIVLVDIHT